MSRPPRVKFARVLVCVVVFSSHAHAQARQRVTGPGSVSRHHQQHLPRDAVLLKSVAALADVGNSAPIQGHVVSIVDTGAVGDNTTINTVAIQRAIDRCWQESPNGCTVLVPPGAYRTASITLRSNQRLHIAANAGLYGSADPRDYTISLQWFGGHQGYNFNALVFVHNVSNVSVTGANTNTPDTPGNASIIDGVGWTWWCQAGCTPLHQAWCDAFNPNNASLPTGMLPEPRGTGRPRLVNVYNSTSVTLAGFTTQNSPQWTIHVQNSRDVVVANMTVLSPRAVGNTDGVDPESSQDVIVTDTHIDVGDDGVSIKSYNITIDGVNTMVPCTRVTMRRLVIRSRNWCIGSGTFGGVSDVLFEDSVVGGPNMTVPWAFKFKSHDYFPGPIENVMVRRITVGDVGATPWMYPKGTFGTFQLGLTYGDQPPPHGSPSGYPVARNITFEDITVASSDTPGSITGLHDSCFEHLTLRNITFGVTRSLDWHCSNVQTSTLVSSGVKPPLSGCSGPCSSSRSAYMPR